MGTKILQDKKGHLILLTIGNKKNRCISPSHVMKYITVEKCGKIIIMAASFSVCRYNPGELQGFFSSGTRLPRVHRSYPDPQLPSVLRCPNPIST